MASRIYLGYPPQHVIDWINAHSKPAAGPKTKMTFADGSVEEYDLSGVVTIETMVEAGLAKQEVLDNPETTDVWLREPKSVEIGTDVTGLAMTFYMCGGLTDVTIPDSVEFIEYAAFIGCSSLTGVTIPNSVSSIGQVVFGLCNSFTSVTIPDSVISVGDMAFYMCENLTSIVVEGRTTKEARELLANALPDTSIVTGTKKSVTKITFADGTSREYSWSGDVTQQTMIDAGLYDGSSWIKQPQTVEIESEVTGIGDSVFQGCTGLTSVTIPDSVTSIGSSTFSGCTGLTSMTIPDSVTSIGSSAFSDCTGLTSVAIPNGVTSIGDSVFQGCTGLTSMTIGNGVTSIGNNAFAGCNGLTNITIPNGVTSIGSNAFSGCSGLTSVVVQCMTTPEARELLANAGLSDTDIVIGDATIITFADKTSQRYSWSGEITQQTMKNAGLYNGSSWIKEPQTVELGPTVTSIGDSAFYDCTSLADVTMPDSVTSIDRQAFFGCSGLTRVTIGNGVTSIGYRAFYGCSSLTSMTIPDSVTSIGSYAFYDCSSLTSMTIPDSVTSIGSNAFYGCSSLTSVVVEGKTTKQARKMLANAGLSNIDIVTGASTLITFTDGTSQEYDWSGNITQQTMKNAGLYNGSSWIKQPQTVELGSKVTSINDYTFRDCAGLTSVMVLNGVTSIGSNAFYGCSSLTSIVVYDRTTTEARELFANLSDTNIVVGGLTLITFTDGTSQKYSWSGDIIQQTMIDAGLYNGSSWIKQPQTVELGSKVTSIGGYTFRECTGLTNVTIPKSVTNIVSYAFYGCIGLTSIVAEGRTTAEAREKFASLSDVNIVIGGLTLIAFTDGTSQKYSWSGEITQQTMRKVGLYDGSSWIKQPQTVEIGPNVTSIGSSTFSGCTGLTSIVVYDRTTTEARALFANAGLSDVNIVTGASTLITFTDRTSQKYSWSGEISGTTMRKAGLQNTNGSTWIKEPQTVEIGSEVTSIKDQTFRGCAGLTNITISKSVTSVGSYVFYECSLLTSIVVDGRTTAEARELFANANLSDINIVTGSIQEVTPA